MIPTKFDVNNLIEDARNEGSLVIMMCGVAGSGKTTFAQKLEKIGFSRLSIDEEIWSTNGRYGIDYPVGQYKQYAVKAELKLKEKLISLIKKKRNIVIDFSFWQKKQRDNYKKLIEATGGMWKLIYLKVPPEILRTRLEIRSKMFDANAAFTITDELLNSFIYNFEAPSGEGEIVVDNKKTIFK